MARPGTPSEDTPDAGRPGSALPDQLRMILERFPDLVQNPAALARVLAPDLVAAGLVAGPATATSASPVSGNATEARVLKAIAGHPSGRHPGLAPDALAYLSGLSGAPLARAVSALVQAGELVREAWLVRLPDAGDLLPQPMSQERADRREEHAEEHASDDPERRAIGDRRSIGERRLYDRRAFG